MRDATRQFGLVIVLLGLISGLAGPARADLIAFDNLGPNNSFSAGGYGVSGSNTSFGPEIQGYQFIAQQTVTLDKIEVAIQLLFGSNQIDLVLKTDNAGLFGDTIETYHITGQFGTSGSIISADSILHPLLTVGTKYWLVATEADADTRASWLENLAGSVGLHYNRYYQSGTINEISSMQNLGAMRLTGSFVASVPEPSSLVILGAGGIGFLGAMRRKRSAA